MDPQSKRSPFKITINGLTNISSSIRFLIVVFSVVLYLGFFVLLIQSNLLEEVTLRNLILIPVVAVSLSYGLRGAILAIIFAVIYTTVFFSFATVEEVLSRSSSVISFILMLMLGVAVGSLTDVYRELKRSTRALRNKEQILEVASKAAEKLIKSDNWKQDLPIILDELGTKIEASRIFLFKSLFDSKETKNFFLTHLMEWTAKGIEKLFGNPMLQKLDLKAVNLDRWVPPLRNGEVIQALTSNLSQKENAFLSKLGVKSLLVVPIWVNNEMWGVIGFDDTKFERVWVEEEMEALKIIASILGSSIENQSTQEKLKKHNERLERITKAMTGREMKMIKMKKHIEELTQELETYHKQTHAT